MTRAMLFKLVNLVFAAAFLLAALVQYNDPDPWVWITVYLVALGCALAFHRDRLHPAFGLAVALLALAWALTLIPTVVNHPPALSDVFGDVKMYGPGVEEAREAGGLLLIAGWIGAVSLIARRRK
jgi:hypothetical protein